MEKDRRWFFKMWAATTVGLGIAACGKTPQSIQETADLLDKVATALASTQTAEAKNIPTLTPRKVTPTPQPTSTSETPTSLFTQEDEENLEKIRETNSGEDISFNDPLISYVVKIPRPLVPDAVYAVLAIQKDGGEKGIGIVENFDCGLDELQKADKLGNPLGSDKIPAISGLWKPNQRFENISGKMFIEASVGTIAVVTGNSYQLGKNESAVECQKKSMFTGAGDLPEKLAREAGGIIKNVIEGFKEGYFDEK